MDWNNVSDISPDELRERLVEKGAVLTDEQLSAVDEVLMDWSHEKSEDGLFTLLSVRWKTCKNRYVRISIPW